LKKEVLGKCPVCQGELKVTEITCDHCDTVIKSEFELCKFCRLDKQQRYFAEIFIKNRGNIREIEKELGISYPTVRNKIDELIAALGYKVEQQSVYTDRKEVLERLSRGEITKEEALKLLSS